MDITKEKQRQGDSVNIEGLADSEDANREEQPKASGDGLSRRTFLGVGSASLASAALGAMHLNAQSRSNIQWGETDHSTDNPGPENAVLRDENPSSNLPPATDHGNIDPVWYSFDLTHKRIQEGGWTNQVNAFQLPSSQDIAGVRMRLTAGSFRELHWHTSDEWAYMLYGKARLSVLNPDGTVFLGDVEEGDLWYFPAGFPHSIQGLGPDGAEFMLVFNQGNFSEDNTLLLSDWVAHTPPAVLAKNLDLAERVLKSFPKENLYIFPADLPGSLAADKSAVGGRSVESPYQYTFKMKSMAPTKKTPGGEVRVVDVRSFTAAKNICGVLITLKPGGMRELHWHPHASEWQYYITGRARMTVFTNEGARTMDFRANDVGFVPRVAGHYIENVGDTDVNVLEVFATGEFSDISLNNWLRRLPPEMVKAHLKLDENTLKKVPSDILEVVPGPLLSSKPTR